MLFPVFISVVKSNKNYLLRSVLFLLSLYTAFSLPSLELMDTSVDIYRFVFLPSTVRAASYCRGQWLMKRLITGKSVERHCECSVLDGTNV